MAVNDSLFWRIIITHLSILEKSLRVVNQAEREGIIFDMRFKFTKLGISEISRQTGFDRKTVKKSPQVKDNF
jgi:hypothetical protein